MAAIDLRRDVEMLERGPLGQADGRVRLHSLSFPLRRYFQGGENEELMSNTFYGWRLFTASLKIRKRSTAMSRIKSYPAIEARGLGLGNYGPMEV